VAQTEFDRVRMNPGTNPDVSACGQRYLEATTRLRKFLTDGEVPLDVKERLSGSDPVSDLPR
jgi:hypothetical protein